MISPDLYTSGCFRNPKYTVKMKANSGLLVGSSTNNVMSSWWWQLHPGWKALQKLFTFVKRLSPGRVWKECNAMAAKDPLLATLDAWFGKVMEAHSPALLALPAKPTSITPRRSVSHYPGALFAMILLCFVNVTLSLSSPRLNFDDAIVHVFEIR